MNRTDLLEHFSTVHRIVAEADRFVPTKNRGVAEFRAEIGGLLTVVVASCFENAVKSILIDYSSRHHFHFGSFIERSYSKLNSRVSINDLNKYCGLAGISVQADFKARLTARKRRYLKFSHVEIAKSYEQILAWRHSYAHSGKKETSIEEAYRTYREAIGVIISFQEAFEEACP